MKIFLTGGTGFIGSHVLKQLLASDIEVIAHRRKESSSPKILIDDSINWLTKSITFLTIDDFKGVDIMVHLAAHSVQYPHDTLENCIKFNVLETLDLFETAAKAGVKKFLTTGTCYEYGSSRSEKKKITADSRLFPDNAYSLSKAMAYLALRHFTASHNVTLYYFRVFHAYGEGQPKERLWPYLKLQAEKDLDATLSLGDQILDFIEVSLVADKLLSECKSLNLDCEEAKFVTGNIGSGLGQTVKQFAEKWWVLWNAKGELRFSKSKNRSKRNQVLIADEETFTEYF